MSVDRIGDLRNALATASEGDAHSCISAAMWIHLFPIEAREIGANMQYASLVSRAMQSQDPEFLVLVAEELMTGKRLAADAKTATAFLERARGYSPFMAQYIFGRILAPRHPEQAMKALADAEKAGHLPSRVLRHRLLVKTHPFGFALSPLFQVMDFLVLWSAVRAAQKDKRRFRDRLWRYKDFVRPAALPRFEKWGYGPDRAPPINPNLPPVAAAPAE